jgi:hypothetical protein
LWNHFYCTRHSERAIVFARNPEAVQYNRQFSSHCGNSSLFGILAASLGYAQTPPANVAIFAKPSENMMRTLNEQSPQAAIATFGDPELRGAITTLTLLGD